MEIHKPVRMTWYQSLKLHPDEGRNSPATVSIHKNDCDGPFTPLMAVLLRLHRGELDFSGALQPGFLGSRVTKGLGNKLKGRSAEMLNGELVRV
jgi:hypothetical protein